MCTESSRFICWVLQVVHHHRSRPDSCYIWGPDRWARTVSGPLFVPDDTVHPPPKRLTFLSMVDMRSCCSREVCTLTCGWSSSRLRTVTPHQTQKPKIWSLRNCSHHQLLQVTTDTECTLNSTFYFPFYLRKVNRWFKCYGSLNTIENVIYL